MITVTSQLCNENWPNSVNTDATVTDLCKKQFSVDQCLHLLDDLSLLQRRRRSQIGERLRFGVVERQQH